MNNLMLIIFQFVFVITVMILCLKVAFLCFRLDLLEKKKAF